jgi:hypothetical protein
VIAQDSGNRANESFLAITLARVEAEHGDPLASLDYVTLAIRRHHDTGNVALIRPALTILAAFLDRLGRCEPAATIAGFAFSPLSATTFPEINTAIAHLRDVLGGQTYESLARKGAAMTTAAMATYAYDQIDQARAELEAGQTTFETSQTDTDGIGSARSLRLKSSSQKKPSQYCDTALMQHTFRNECTEANFGARIRYSDNVSGPLPTSTVVLPTACTDPYVTLASACLGTQRTGPFRYRGRRRERNS